MQEKKQESVCVDCTSDPPVVAARTILRDIVKDFFSLNAMSTIEGQSVLYAAIALLFMSGIYALSAPLVLGQNSALLAAYFFPLWYLLSGLIILAAVLWYLKAHQSISCSTGMMVGMTMGMVTGFIVGLIIGSTNGMFVGSVIGIVAGIVIGTWTGKHCGIMGILEGQMAGFMAGPMGAMASIMMLADNYLLFIPLSLVFMAVIFLGLMYLVKNEYARQGQRPAYKHTLAHFVIFMIAVLVVFMAFVLIVLYGPKSSLFTILV